MQEINIGDIVYVPCLVVGKAAMAYTEGPILDLRPIESTSGEVYAEGAVHRFSVYEGDVLT